MRKFVILTVLLMFVMMPQIGVTQSTELPLRIAYFSEVFEGGVEPANLTFNLLEDAEWVDISSDYALPSIDFFNLAWSPNCEQIIFNTSSQALIIYDLNTTTYTMIDLDLERLLVNLRWSPDGSLIAIKTWNGEQESIMVMSADGSALREIYTGEEQVYLEGWSPDSQHLWFTEVAGNLSASSGYMYDFATEEVEYVYGGRGFYRHLTVSPDNTQIAYVSDNNDLSVSLVDTLETQLITISPLSSNITSLIWSPDSEQLAYSDDFYLWTTSSADTGEARNLTEFSTERPPYFTSPRIHGWTVDGEYIVFEALQTRTAELFAITPEGNNLTQLTTLELNADDSGRISLYSCMLPDGEDE